MRLRPWFLFACLATGLLPAKAQPAPVAQWTLDALDKRTVASAGPLGRPGQILGEVKGVPGRVGGAAAFQPDPLGQIILPLDLGLLKSGAFTVSFWLRPQGRPEAYGTCLDAGGAKGFVIRVNSGGRLGLSTGGAWNVLTAPEKLLEGVWTHVALAYDGAQFRLYADGSPVGVVAPDQPPRIAPELELGAVRENTRAADGVLQQTTVKPLPGDLDQVAVYDRALSAAEIAALAKSAR